MKLRTGIVVVFLQLIPQVLCQSITKCGDTGNSSLFFSPTLPYMFYNNPWGNDGSGFSCITVKNNGTAFDATWRWENNSDRVHAYPHFKFDSPDYPLPLAELSSVEFKGTWGVNITSAAEENAESRTRALDENDVQFNVALDMFLDSDPEQALTELPHYEIMIWLSYSYDVYPVGIDTSTPDKEQYVLGDTRFFLYRGNNTEQQQVFSWLAESNITSVDTDYSPLVHYLWQADLMPKDLYLGTLQFGTETYHSQSEVLFQAADYSMALGKDESLDIPPLETPKPVSVPTQVPTMERFKSDHMSAASRVASSCTVGAMLVVWFGLGALHILI